MKRIFLAVSAALLLLSACAKAEPVETTMPVIESMALVVTEDTIGRLEDYPDLKQVNLAGSTCYAAIEDYIASHPGVDVHYTVSLGGTNVPADTGELTLAPGSFDCDLLMSELGWLHSLKKLDLPRTDLTAEQIQALRERWPDIKVTYTVQIGDTEYDGDTEILDLSACTEEELMEAAPRLSLLHNVRQVELMSPEGTSDLTLEQVAQIQKLAPDTLFHYTFTLFGKTISTTDEEILYKDQYIGNKIEGAEDQLYQALSIVRGCRRFVLDNCHFPNEVLAQLRDEFRDTTMLVWRVRFGADGSCLTDREIIRYMPSLTGENSHDLIYCEGARFVDVGHNEMLFNCDFVAGMPNLEAIILSGSPIRDLSGFANCKNLVFLELAFCAYVEDISALASCTNLRRLNIAYTGISDLSPLDGLELEVMVDTHAPVSVEERIRFEDLQPGCLVQHSGEQPYGYPWRYTEDKEYNEYYAMLREIFDYDHPTQTRY